MEHTRVILPDGHVIEAHVAVTRKEKARGLAGVYQLGATRGMLFPYEEEGYYPYWMAGCLIPLDIIWMDSGGRVVQVCRDCQPQDIHGSQLYGGEVKARCVLEIGTGEALKHGVQLGTELKF